MKRVLSLILAVVLAFSCLLAFSSCSAEVTYEEFHEKAVEAHEKLYNKTNKKIDEDTTELVPIKGQMKVTSRGETKKGKFTATVYKETVVLKSASDDIEWYANLYVGSTAAVQLPDELFHDYTYKAGPFGFEITDGTTVKRYNSKGLLTHYESDLTTVDINW